TWSWPARRYATVGLRVLHRRPMHRRAWAWFWLQYRSCDASDFHDGAGDDARRQFDLVVIVALSDGAFRRQQACTLDRFGRERLALEVGLDLAHSPGLGGDTAQ